MITVLLILLFAYIWFKPTIDITEKSTIFWFYNLKRTERKYLKLK
jgi:hypothetical protein